MTKGVWFRNKELHPLMWHRCYFRITTTTKSVAKINVKIEQMKKNRIRFHRVTFAQLIGIIG